MNKSLVTSAILTIPKFTYKLLDISTQVYLHQTVHEVWDISTLVHLHQTVNELQKFLRWCIYICQSVNFHLTILMTVSSISICKPAIDSLSLNDMLWEIPTFVLNDPNILLSQPYCSVFAYIYIFSFIPKKVWHFRQTINFGDFHISVPTVDSSQTLKIPTLTYSHQIVHKVWKFPP